MSRARRRRAARRRTSARQAALAVAVLCAFSPAAASADGGTATTPAGAAPDTSPTALIGSSAQAGASPPTTTVALPRLPAAAPSPAAKRPTSSSPSPGAIVLPKANGQEAPAVAPSVGAATSQTPTGTKQGVPNPTGLPYGSPAAVAAAAAAKAAAQPVASSLRAANGLPVAADPTLSLTALGPVPIGVPDFFIQTFAIPPFLIPIYQAAGVEYEVPWQILAAINEIETDYGRNLSVSSAGAEGWMQFLPQTWKEYGVDANGDGVKDPYNPVDAIFAAARFLHAAGASQSLPDAIFAFDQAKWYVDSVTLRAKLIGGLPTDLLSSLTGLTDGRFPVHAPARYADDVAEGTAQVTPRTAAGVGAGAGTSRSGDMAIKIYAKAGSPAIAVHDGVVTGLGETPALGKYVELRDVYGNTYTYSGLKTLTPLYAVPLPQTASTAQINRGLTLPADPAPKAAATAGHQAAAGRPGPTAVPVPSPVLGAAATTRAASIAHLAAAGLQSVVARAARSVDGNAGRPANLAGYLTESYGLTPADVDLRPLTTGAHVIAGAILGRIGVTQPGQAPHLGFQIRPAGLGSPLIDPKPILDDWKLLEATATYRAAKLNPFFGPAAVSPPVGQLMLESKAALQQQVLSDQSITISACGRRAVTAGLIDQRALARLEFLSLSGAKPTVTGVGCTSATAIAPFRRAGSAGRATSATGPGGSAVTGLLVLGGTTSDPLIPRLLSLSGTFAPLSVVTPSAGATNPPVPAAGAAATPAGPGGSTPGAAAPAAAPAGAGTSSPAITSSAAAAPALTPAQWVAIVRRLDQIGNPSVARRPSSAAIPVAPSH